MIHKVKYGMMEVVLDTAVKVGRAPDLVFKGTDGREFAVFFAPASTAEGQKMKAAYYDYYAPFESAALSEEDLNESMEENSI